MTTTEVALTGALFSGKTTVAKLLRDRGFYFMDYTGYIKQLAAVEWKKQTGQEVTALYLEEHKREFRRFLQKFGTDIGTGRGFGVAHVASQFSSAKWPTRNMVFDNIRYERQFDVLRNIHPSFVLVRLEINEHEQIARARRKGVFPEELADLRLHQAEQPVEAEITVDGNQPAYAIANIFLRLAGLREYHYDPAA